MNYPNPLNLNQKTLIIFAGIYSKKYSMTIHGIAGWGDIIKSNKMKVSNTISLPTVWTFQETEETSYFLQNLVS